MSPNENNIFHLTWKTAQNSREATSLLSGIQSPLSGTPSPFLVPHAPCLFSETVQ